jgi:hypothetical protein
VEQTRLCGYSQELAPGSNFKVHESIVNLIPYLFKVNFNIMVALRLLLRFLPFSFSAKKFPHFPHIYSMCNLSSPAFASLNVCFKNSLTQIYLLKHRGGYTHNVRNNSSLCLSVYLSISYDSQRKEWFFLKSDSATRVGNVESVFCEAEKIFLYHIVLQMVKDVANLTEWCHRRPDM